MPNKPVKRSRFDPAPAIDPKSYAGLLTGKYPDQSALPEARAEARVAPPQQDEGGIIWNPATGKYEEIASRTNKPQLGANLQALGQGLQKTFGPSAVPPRETPLRPEVGQPPEDSPFARFFEASTPEARQDLIKKGNAELDAQQAELDAQRKTIGTVVDSDKDAKVREGFQEASLPHNTAAVRTGVAGLLKASPSELSAAEPSAQQMIKELQAMSMGDIRMLNEQQSLLLKDPDTMTRNDKLALGMVALLPLFIGAMAGGKQGVQQGIAAMLGSTGAFIQERAKATQDLQSNLLQIQQAKSIRQKDALGAIEAEGSMQPAVSPIAGTEVVDPGLLGKLSKHDITEARAGYDAAVAAEDRVVQLMKLIEKNGVGRLGVWQDKDEATAVSLANQAKLQAKVSWKLGVLSETDYKFLSELIPDPDSIMNVLQTDEGIVAKYQAFLDDARKSKLKYLTGIGVREAGMQEAAADSGDDLYKWLPPDKAKELQKYEAEGY